MPRFVLPVVYTLMILIGLVACYSLLNAGHPHSLLRLLLPDPAADVYVAMISSFTVFVLGFIVFYSRDLEGFRRLIRMNQEKIRALRLKGQSDDAIAAAILAAMGSSSGYRHNLARKKLILHLSRFK